MTITNSPVRAATSPELVKLRASGQGSNLRVAIHHPVTVYTARINGAPSSNDGVAQLTYNGGSGTLGNVLINQIIFIGSSAGLYDKGIVRVRQLPTSTIFYISQTSNIQFANNDYLTVVDSMPIMQRDVTVNGGIVNMDYDIEFGSLTNGGAIMRIGPLVSVLELTGATVIFSPVDPSLSACYDGASIVSYLFAFPGASATSGLGTTSPTATYNATGEYRWSCTATDDLGRTTTAYRRLFVSPASRDFVLLGPVSGDYQTGDWSYSVKLRSNTTKTEIYDRALITLYTQDYYQQVLGSIGKLTGYENILCSGWVDGESIEFDSESSSVSFSVHGPAYWLAKLRAFPLELADTSIAASSWKEIKEMTVDKALAQILYWTTTAPMVMDCFFSDDTNRVNILIEPAGTLKSQLDAIAMNNIFAHLLCNNYGQMFVQVDVQILDTTARSALKVVMDITTADYGAPLEIDRNTSAKVSMVELGAFANYDGVAQVEIFSHAPGVIPVREGDPRGYSNYIITNQDKCNRIAGCLLANENNEIEPIDIDFPANLRLFDIAPNMYATITVAAADNARGVALTAVRLIPRRVAYRYLEDGAIVTSVTFEVEAISVDGVTYIPPTLQTDNMNSFRGNVSSVDFPTLDTSFPAFLAPNVLNTCIAPISNTRSLPWSISNLNGTDSTKLVAEIYLPCTLQGSAHSAEATYPSRLYLAGHWYNDAKNEYAVYGIKNGANIVTGTISHGDFNNSVSFVPASDTVVDGFRIVLNAGAGTGPFTDFSPGGIVETGGPGAATTLCVLNDYYCIELASGFWTGTFPAGIVGHNMYNFARHPDNTGYNNGVGLSYTGGFKVDLPSGCFKSEAVDSQKGRTYFISGTAGLNQFIFKPASTGALGVVDTMTWILRSAIVNGRRIALSSCNIYNVCAP